MGRPDDYSSIADAMSRALDELSRSLAREILNHQRRDKKAASMAAAETEEERTSEEREPGEGE